MPLAQNQSTLDYVSGGYPFLSTLAKNSIDPDGLDLSDEGAPFYASLGEVSTSVLLATQVVNEFLRDATDVGGGNLRVTEVATEVLIVNSETIYATHLVLERLSITSQAYLASLGVGKSWMVFRPDDFFDIVLSSGEVSSAADELAVLNGTNLALLGKELLQYRDVTSLGGNSYRLSHLLRGRYGSEWAMNRHNLSELFIGLESLLRVREGITDLNVIRQYKAVSVGMSLGLVFPHHFIDTGVSQKPYAPCHVTGARDGSNNLTISWIQRGRYSADWVDYVDIPLVESTESYEIVILNPSTGAVVRTLTSVVPIVEYSAANQTTDFGGVQALVSVIIYQMNQFVGRGYGSAKNI